MGLIVDVFRFGHGDFTNNGISSAAQSICLVNVEGPTNPKVSSYVRAMLVPGNGAGYVKIVPAELQSDGTYGPVKDWCMMGGNFAYTSDSRFTAAVKAITGQPCWGAVPIHDRIED